MNKVAKINQQSPPAEWDFSLITFFNERDEMIIKKLAAGLSDSEVWGYFGLEDPEALNVHEQRFLRVTIMRGRSESKRLAVDKLFKIMGSNSPKAADACIAFLKTNADNWKEAEMGDGSSAKTVTINIDDGGSAGQE